MATAFIHNRRPGAAVVVLSGAHIHRYKRAEVVAPTCNEQGYTIRSCKCGDSYKTDYTDALGHEYGDWISDETGHWHVCNRCGEVSDVVPHTPGAEATEDTAQICSVCGYVLAPATGHIHKYTDEVIAPTCTEKGYTTHTCKCGDSYTDSETEALGHDIVSTIIKAASCYVEGQRYCWCSRDCGHSYYETIGVTHHPVEISAVPATCTSAGSTRGVKCSYCGEIFMSPQTIPALGHDWVGDPRYQHCSRCGISIHEVSSDEI